MISMSFIYHFLNNFFSVDLTWSILIVSYKSAWKTWMNSIDCFLISYLVPKISTFKVLIHDTQNWFTANSNNSQNCDVIQYLQRNLLLFQNFQPKIKSHVVHSQHHGSATGLSKFYKDLMVDGNENQFYGVWCSQHTQDPIICHLKASCV